jgi:hypothetical protein
VSIASLGCNKSTTTPDNGPDEPDDLSYQVLFIGSSYFNENDTPGMVDSLADFTRKDINVHEAVIPGLHLDMHASSAETEIKINEQPWDYVVLQGEGKRMAYPEFFTDHAVYPALVTLAGKIRSNSDSTKIILTLPWAFKDGMTWVGDGWTDQYAEMQQKIHENTLVWSNNLDLIIAPVGWAWKAALDEGDYILHDTDRRHPSAIGSYIQACVIYSTIYKESTRDFDYAADIPWVHALTFQSIASRIVLDSLKLWNIE